MPFLLVVTDTASPVLLLNTLPQLGTQLGHMQQGVDERPVDQ